VRESVGLLLAAAALLSLERAAYVGIVRAPGVFRRWCARPALVWIGEPVAIVRRLFYIAKALQVSVFLGWCYVHGNGSLAPATSDPAVLGVAGALMVLGQGFVWAVFYRLGSVGAFFGARLGHDVRWCRGFPFSLLAHPQYIGTVMTIWGFFLAMRFPRDDWYLLPAVETVYYAVGGYLEARG
jgi:hypothetical protein